MNRLGDLRRYLNINWFHRNKSNRNLEVMCTLEVQSCQSVSYLPSNGAKCAACRMGRAGSLAGLDPTCPPCLGIRNLMFMTSLIHLRGPKQL